MLYQRPETVEDAVSLLADGAAAGAPWRILAGGTDLYPATIRQALDGPILDIAAMDELSGIAETAEGWRIGARATWSELIAAPLPPAFDALKEAARELGSVQIQNAATLVGNLCNASPAADGMPALMVLDAEIELAGPAGRRRLALGDFVLGNRRTARAPDEIAVALHLPYAAGAGVSAFEKLGARRYLVISIAMVAARVEVARGRIARAAVAVGACSEVARRLPALEAALAGAEIGALETDPVLIAEALAPIDDVRATAAYRREAAAELVRRAVLRAAGIGTGAPASIPAGAVR